MAPGPSSHTISVQRACDRCFSLKTQCDLTETCARCQRLGLKCTRRRPIRPLGRPKGRRNRSGLVPSRSISQHGFDGNQGSNMSSSPDSAANLGVCHALLADLPGQSFDPSLATRLLDHMLSFGDGLGFYGILSGGMPAAPSIQPSDSNDQSFIRLEAIVASAPHFLTPTLLSSLLSVALELRRDNIPHSDQESAEYSKDSLRASSLARIPTLCWHYRARASDVFALLFFSATWCFTPHLIEVSTRWNNLASIILMDVIKEFDSSTDRFERERMRIAIMGIELQQRVLSLLLNRHFLPRLSNSPESLSRIHRAAYNLPPESFLGIFTALARAADLVLGNPEFGSRAWKDAYNALENFYMTFPSTLLKLADLQFLYHAEAMIWMHGLFIILYAKRDLLDIIIGPDVLSKEILPHVLGHSLLLGEVLTSFECLSTNLESLSPATVFFLLISCATNISVLARYAPAYTENYEMQFEIGGCSVPESLVTSSWVHLQVLSTVRARCTRFQSPVLCEIERLLASCYNRVVLRYSYTETISAEILMLHRWKGQGSGILAMDPTAALAEWNFLQPPEADIWSHLGCHSKSSKLILDEVCSPRSRICEAGYFDLSILIRD